MGTYKSYITGFVVCVALTLAAYAAVTNALPQAVPLIFALAAVQALVQLIFFLHMDKGPDARLNWVFFLFAALVIVIVVGGSLWIMDNLNYNMTPGQMNASMLDQAE